MKLLPTIKVSLSFQKLCLDNGDTIKIAKQCVNYGQRVQNSVFECVVDGTQFEQLKIILREIIDPEKDSLRFYSLGKNYKHKVVHFGIRESIDLEGVLLL